MPPCGPLAELIKRTGVADRVCVGSFFDHRLVAAARRRSGPTSPRRWVRGKSSGWSARERAAAPVVRTARGAAQVPVSFRGVPIVTPRFLRAAHAAGLEVHVWTIDDPAEMRRLLAWASTAS